MTGIDRDDLLALQRPSEKSTGDRKCVIDDALRHPMADDIEEANIDGGLAKLGRERPLGCRTLIRAREVEHGNFDEVFRAGGHIFIGAP